MPFHRKENRGSRTPKNASNHPLSSRRLDIILAAEVERQRDDDRSVSSIEYCTTCAVFNNVLAHKRRIGIFGRVKGNFLSTAEARPSGERDAPF
jgi:hypothetical protein